MKKKEELKKVIRAMEKKEPEIIRVPMTTSEMIKETLLASMRIEALLMKRVTETKQEPEEPEEDEEEYEDSEEE